MRSRSLSLKIAAIVSVWLASAGSSEPFALAGPAPKGPDPKAHADAFLRGQGLERALRELAPDEKAALGTALSTPRRKVSDDAIAGLLRNPTAWSASGSNGRGLLRTIVKSLPDVATVPGVDHTLRLSSNENAANYRGYGVEVIASAALNRYCESGQRARMTRMGGDVCGVDGRLRESDGAVLIGADGVERLVTVKSLSSIRSMHKTLNKAADQLALRNLQRDGSRRPGVMVIGYDDPAIQAKLRTKDWQAKANRTGAKLLVLAVDQRTGKTEKLAAYEPDPNSTLKPKTLAPRQRWSKKYRRKVMGFIGRRSPRTAARISRFAGRLDRLRHKGR